MFAFVLKLVAELGLVKGEMQTRMAKESGVETPTIDDLIRLDRKRKSNKLSNEDWMSKTDPDAKIAKMKDGSTHLAYKPEHAVDLDTGVIVAAPIHEADKGDTATLDPTLKLKEAEKHLSAVGFAPTPEDPCDLVADKGYLSRDVLKGLDDGPWKTRIAEPRPSKGYSRWHGDDEARKAVYGNRNRLKSGVGREAMRKRGELVERSFAHILDRGGMRRTWLCGRENVHKRYLVHVAGYNLGILMRALFGAGTPREAAAIRNAFVFVIQTAETIAFVILATSEAEMAALIVALSYEASPKNPDFVTALISCIPELHQASPGCCSRNSHRMGTHRLINGCKSIFPRPCLMTIQCRHFSLAICPRALLREAPSNLALGKPSEKASVLECAYCWSRTMHAWPN